MRGAVDQMGVVFPAPKKSTRVTWDDGVANGSDIPPSGVGARWTPALARSGWCPVPHALLANLQALELTVSETLLLLQIASFKWDERMPFPSTRELARRMRMSERGVTKLLARLEEGGFIRRERHGRRRDFDLSGLFKKLESLIKTNL